MPIHIIINNNDIILIMNINHHSQNRHSLVIIEHYLIKLIKDINVIPNIRYINYY